MDLKAIADAIAGRFVGLEATLSNGPEALAMAPTASLPNTIAKGPVLLVYHPIGQLEIGIGRRRHDHYDFPVRLLRDPMNVPARSDALYAWATVMRDRVEAKETLGLPYVAKAWPIQMRIEIDGQTYGEAGHTLDVAELVVRVLVIETVPTVGTED